MLNKTAVPALALLLLACATRQPGDPLKPGYNVFSKQQDVELGQQAAAEISKQVDVVDSQELQSYIRDLGARLATQTQAEDYPYKFTLINDDSINAFALPGGPIFVHSGLLDAAETEGQLVGVLSHEISHVALRHGTSQASKAQMIQLPAVLAGAVMGQQSVWSQVGQIGLGLGLNALIMKYSRSAEKQADALGARIMAGAGYDPVEMANFFTKLEEQGGPRPPPLLSSHPSPGNRVTLVRAEMESFPPADYGYSTGRFSRSEQLVAQLPPPKKPEHQEAATGAPAPSPPADAFQRVQGKAFSLDHPSGWQVYGDQSSGTVTMAPKNGIVRTQGGGGGIGYGAVVSFYRPRYQADLLNATWELLQEMQEVNPNLKAAIQPRQVSVSGNPGLIVGLTGRSPYRGAEREMLLTVSRPQGIFYMVFIAPEKQFSQLQPAFERMVRSIRFQ